MSTMLAKAEWHVRCLLKRSLTRDIKCVADEILQEDTGSGSCSMTASNAS